MTGTPRRTSPRLPHRPGPHEHEAPTGEQAVQAPDRPAHLAHGVGIEAAVGLGVHVDDVGDILHPGVGHVAVGREQHPLRREVAGEDHGLLARARALGPALQQVEVLAVRGDLDVHRRAQGLAQDLEEGAHAGEEGRVGDQSLERHHRGLPRQVDEPSGTADAVVTGDGHDLPQERYGQALAPGGEEGGHVDGLEAPGLEIDHVQLLRRVVHGLVAGLIHPQARLARGHQHGIVVAEAIDRPRPQPWDEPQQAVLAPDAGRPAQLVVAEGHAREDRQEVGADPAAHHLLDEHPHLLMEIEKAAPRPVLDGIGPEDRGVDLGDGIRQSLQALPLAAGVGEEETLVLAREGGAQPVFEEARAAYDDRPPFEVVEHGGEAAQHLRREERILEQLHHVRVFEPHPLGIVVLAVEHLAEIVLIEEVEQAVGRDVPAPGDADLAELHGPRRACDHLAGEEEAGGFAPHPPAAGARDDDALRQLVEVHDPQRLLGRVDEVELLGEETAGEPRAQTDLRRRRQLALFDVAVAEALQRVDQLGERPVEPLDGVLQESGLVLLDPALEERQDRVVAEVGGGEPERLLGYGGVGSHGRARQRPVVVQLGFVQLGGRASQELLGSLDAVPAEVVDHLPPQPPQQGAVGLAQEVEDHPPLGGGRLHR